MSRLFLKWRLSKRIKSQEGFTLIELLVASAMSVVVVGAAMTMLVTALKDQPKISERADQVGQARTVNEQMVTQLRQGLKVETKEKSKVVFVTYVRASACTSAPSASAKPIPCRVTYSCVASGGKCTKSVLNVDGSGTALTTILVEGISNPTEVFCYMPSTEAGKCGTANAEATTYVGVKLQFKNKEGKVSTTLENGATLRNATLTY